MVNLIGGRFFGNMLDDKQQQLLMEAMQTNAADINVLQEKLRIAQQELVKSFVRKSMMSRLLDKKRRQLQNCRLR